ncbi:MAG: nucleotide exchange factor GrpE [Candidatus Woesearchaeota archaeon]|jgi:molecular chaperone GrpE
MTCKDKCCKEHKTEHNQEQKESCCKDNKEQSCKGHNSQQGCCKEQHSEKKECCNQDNQQTKSQSQPEHLLADLTDTLQRLQAEFENYRKRSDRECNEFRQYANKKLIQDLLPLLDNFDLALKSVKDEGFRLIYSQLLEILGKYGLKKISCEGKFNPKIHEALLQEVSDKDQGTILEELQKGYIVGEVVLRPARVKIAWKPLNEKTSNTST